MSHGERKLTAVMSLSYTVAALALLLGVLLIAGQARAAEAPSMQKRIEAREAARRIELAEHQRRKDEFERRCAKRVLTDAELQACRAAYRRL